MAAFNFPNSPSTNDIHNENGVSWKWNGSVWKKIGTVANTFDQINVTGVSTSVQLNATTVNVTGISTFKAVYVGDDNGSNNNRIRLGASQDLSLWHDGTNSYVANTGGDLFVQTGSAKAVYIRPNNGANGVICHPSGSVSLYHNNVLKFETVSYGVVSKGSVEIQNGSMTTADSSDSGTSNSAIFGTGSDLKVFHDGSNSYIKDTGSGGLRLCSSEFNVKNAANNEVIIRGTENSSVELYHDNSKKLETTSSGVSVTGGITATGDVLFDNGTNANKDILFDASANKLEFSDGVEISLGNGSDLRLYHNGSNSYITSITGNLVIDNSSGVDMYINSGNDIYIRPQGTENGIKLIGDGAVELYHNSSKKLETSSTGISITGIPVATQSTGNVGLELHATGSGRGSQTKYHNDHGEAYVGTAGDTTGNLLIHNTSNTHMLFATNNTERLRINSSGEVGIGVGAASGNLLHIKTSSADSKVKIESESGYDARLQLDTSNGGGAGAHIDFQVDATTVGGIEYVTNASSSAVHDIIFRNEANSERLRIDKDGYIGINDNDSTVGLSINKFGAQPVTNGNTYPYPAGSWSTVWNTTTANSTDYWVGFVGSYDVSSATVNISLTPHHLNLNGQAGLYIAGEATSNAAADFTLGRIISGSQTGASASAGNQRATKTEMLRIDSSGRVLIGTTSTGFGAYGDAVTIYKANHVGLTLRTATNKDAAIYFADSSSGGGRYTGGINYNHSNNYMNFTVNETERLRITSDAKVGINQTTPLAALHIGTISGNDVAFQVGTISGQNRYLTINHFGGQQNFYQVKMRVNDNGMIPMLDLGNPYGSSGHGTKIKFSGYQDNECAAIEVLNTASNNASSVDMVFKTGGTTERLRIKSDGNIVHGSTEAFQIAKGTTGQRPSSPVVGMVRFNTTTDQLENYNSNTGWENVNVKTPIINSISGNIYAGMATNLTLTLTDNSSTVTIIFKEGSTTHATLTNQSVSSGSVTVAVPSAVYGQSAGDTITITVTNSDGVVSSGSNKTVQTAPSGGTITTSGNYRIHSFTSSGTFVNTVASLGVEYLIIAGGGAGGSGGSSVAGGGGGAGGYRSNVSGQSSGGGNSAESSMSLSATSYTVTVGGGASATPGTGDQGGARGSNSSFNSITSTGGGGGGGNGQNSSESSGGSGGGGKESDGAGGSGTSGQGYDGGDGSESNNAGGGGGGAGEEGNTDGFPHGGDGVSSNITGSSVTRGGGGSSGNTSGGYGAVGGAGGGGTASMAHNSAAQSGTANTGGGGGGAYGVSVGASGAGGSGIVIIRYNTTTI